MKNLFLGLALAMCTVSYAQDSGLSLKMELFKEYCIRIRNGIETRNADELMDCISEYEPGKYADGLFSYKGTEIKLASFERVAKIDGLPNDTVLDKHYSFEPKDIDWILVADFMPITLYEAPLLRVTPHDCQFTQRIIASKETAKYSSCGSGLKELFIVAESGGFINLSVKTIKAGNDDTETVATDTIAGGKPCVQAIWKMERFGEYRIEIENCSNREISNE